MNNSNWKANQKLLKNNIAKLGVDQILVHSDSFRSLNFIDFDENPHDNIRKHLKLINSLSDRIVMPVFNYGFPHSRSFDYDNFSCETGVIAAESLRFKVKKTFDPMFAMSYVDGLTFFSNIRRSVKTFGENGIFSKLVSDNSGILFYGVGIRSATLLHHVEALLGVAYRYEKKISGIAIVDGIERKLDFISHFRPKERYLDYDWEKIHKDLISNNIVKSIGRHCHLMNMSELNSFWLEKMSQDHFYFLDKKSLWVKAEIAILGRNFRASDFESIKD